MSSPTPPAQRHALYEDGLAILIGTLFTACGVVFYNSAKLMTGGTTGLGLLAHYATGWGFWVTFSAINLPFYLLAIVRLGWRFALRTALAVSLVACFSAMMPRWMSLGAVDPLFATVFGSALLGNGLLMLFRHRTALGGVNILALYLNERFGWKIPVVQLVVDALAMGASLAFLPAGHVALSLLGAGLVNLILLVNHKPGRYVGTT